MATPYLYEHQNPNAPLRTNGKRFWGYPGRNKAIGVVVVHTTESMLDVIGEDGGAEAVARYQAATDRPSSYQRIVDRDSDIEMLPDGATSFGVVGYNGQALNISLAMRAAEWSDPAKTSAAQPALERAARRVAVWCRAYGIPARFVTKRQVDAGQRGITGHGKLDPERRSDPGADFPWDRFLALVNGYLNPTVHQEDDMTPEQANLLAQIAADVQHLKAEQDMARRDLRDLVAGGINRLLEDRGYERLAVNNTHSLDGVIES